jgi:23S rRNA pseudouridine1911/1915/1917 synthase
MARLRHPLLGDTLYGGRQEAGAVRQMLHARALGFNDPRTGLPCAFTAEPPDDFQRVQDGILWETHGDDHT